MARENGTLSPRSRKNSYREIDAVDGLQTPTPEPYRRAIHGTARVTRLAAPHRFEVQFSDGEPHTVEIYKEAFGLWFGKCDCKGFRLGKVICSHLWRVAQEETVNRLDVPRTGHPLDSHDCPTCGQSLPDTGR